MAKRIIWQNKAVEQFEEIQEYLLAEWGESSAIKFTQKVFQLTNLISRYPGIGSMELAQRNIRGYIVSKQIRMLYQVEQNAIYILALFDTRQNPSNKFTEF